MQSRRLVVIGAGISGLAAAHAAARTAAERELGLEVLVLEREGQAGGKALNTKFKEVLVAALLFECGDDQGEGRKILEAYTKDVNGHFAEYAHHVLTCGTAMDVGK